MKLNYSELLKDPRWQKRRLEIMQLDEFTCQMCGAKDKPLNVHHLYYDKDAEGPWDYDDFSLITLCEDCHQKEHDSRKEFKSTIKDCITTLKKHFTEMEIMAILLKISMSPVEIFDGMVNQLEPFGFDYDFLKSEENEKIYRDIELTTTNILNLAQRRSRLCYKENKERDTRRNKEIYNKIKNGASFEEAFDDPF